MSTQNGSLTLKVKAASLADEAKYIRRLERRIKRNRARAQSEEHRVEHSARLSLLQGHRRVDIRREARLTHLARCVLRGTEFHRVENPATRRVGSPDWERVVTLLQSHTREDVRVIRQRVAAWGDVQTLREAG